MAPPSHPPLRSGRRRSPCRTPRPQPSTRPRLLAPPVARPSSALHELLLPCRKPVQCVERRQGVHVELVELGEERVRSPRKAEQGELGGVWRSGRSLPRHVMTGLQQGEHLPGARHDRCREACELPDVDAVRSIGSAGLEPVQEHDLVCRLLLEKKKKCELREFKN